MVDKARRQELLQQYAARKPQTGVYAVRCAASGEAWVGWSTSLDKRKNALWLQIPAGPNLGRRIHQAWKTHGEASFAYDILEQIEEDNPHALKMKLENRAAHWVRELNAVGTLPSR